jgi:hypothetical protein
MTTFTKGLEVRYNEQEGFIDFVCDKYITVCIRTFDIKSRSVCILVYRNEWANVHLMKESEK